MTYAQAVELLAKRQGTTKAAVHKTLRLLRELVPEAVREEPLLIPGLGVFYRATRKRRVVRDIATGELVPIAKTVSLGFRAATKAKWRLR